MNSKRWACVIEGALIVLSSALGSWVSPAWYGVTVLLALSMIQAGLTGWSLVESVLKNISTSLHLEGSEVRKVEVRCRV